jgi:hypothetical protein
MFWWLVDNVNLVYVLLGVVGLVCAVQWWQTRKRKYAIAFGVVAALMGLVFLLTRLIVTDRQQLVLNVRVMAQALRERKLDTFFEHVSPAFRHGTLDARTFRTFVEERLRQLDVKDFRVWGLATGEVSRADKGQVEFMFQVEAGADRQVPPVRCEAEFAFEEGRWRLRGFQLFLMNQKDPLVLPR